MKFRVEEKDGDIIVTDGVFTAVYFKPDKLDPQLKLKRRTHTDDHALLAHRVDSRQGKGSAARVDCLGASRSRRPRCL